MEKTACSRRELLDRWIGIQDEEDDDDPSPSKQWHIRRAKQNWFSDCYAFLFNLPEVSHIWCGYSDLMGPLLETFHNYFNDKSNDSPLKILWKRISVELEHCTQCIFLYHQAQELYNIEYEFDAVGQLLKVLRRLDEERVTEHIEKINARMKHGEYNADAYNVEVISLMFEVLTYPILLEDHILVKEFQGFLEAVDSYHDVALAGSQQYMGVYALLFLKSGRSRAIGFRLAGCMGKLRSAADLDPLQPLLKKYIGFLGNEVLPSTLDDSRPRVQLERTTVWIGVKTLLGFLEAPAYEEGILEKYPVFLSIVLNHVSGDTLDFSYAVACLRVSFEILGSKLWLRTALSPSVMRNTLLGQCFHTRIEKSHKEIFDLFLPFLQSLEAYLDGEHEKQRRNLLYFLLHQVTQSSNFSDLMRKNACKIALLIVHRGYKMVPPCPPFECAHMWGPTLVNSFKNMSLHNSLRQPAFDLITTIIISDASALISLKQKISTVYKSNLTIQGYLIDEENEFTFSEDVEENDNSCWTEFNMQSKLASSESSCWVCIPMLWIDSLIDIDPAILPISFSKALFWALSHISVLEMNSCVDTSLAVRDWLSIHASEISSSFGWQIPTGFNDGGEGKESRNSVRALSLCTPLLRALKRLAAEFILQLEKIELQKQWTWEPRMAESLILSLVDPDDIVRKTGKIILEHLSNERLLTSGLQFLCSTSSSMSAMLVGLQFMFKQVHCYSMMDSFHCLHHVFFVTGKLLKELVRSPIKAPPVSLSSQGGFLPESLTDHAPSSPYECQQIHVNIKSWEKFSYLLSATMWDPLLKCLVEGKELINNTKCQMTCVRLLETFPAIFERLSLSMPNLSGNIVHLVPSLPDFNWLSDLVDWRRSHLVVVIRHWKQCILSLLSIFKDLYGDLAASIISTIEKIIQSDTIILDYIQEQMLCLISSLSHLYSSRDGRQIIKQKSLPLETFSWKNVPDLGASLFLGSSLNSSVVMNDKSIEKEIVVLSDDEADNEACMEVVASCRTNSASHLHEGFLPTMGKGLLLDDDKESMIANSNRDMLEPFPSGIFVKDDVCSSEEEDQLVMKKLTSNKESVASRIEGFHMQERDYSTEAFKSSSLVKSSHKATNASSKYYLSLPKNPSNKVSNTVPHSDQTTAMVKKLVQDIGDPLELVLDNISRPKPAVSKLTVFAPKRKVIQLQMPENNKSFSLNRMDISSRRLKPPKLDVWYKSILEMDYFVTVGLQATDENEKTTSKLTEVPLHFQSSDQYVKIFQPLVLEEFKAQLRNSFLESPVDDERCSSLSVVSVERIDDFHMIRGRPNEKESTTSIGCIENDLVLLTKDPPENSVQNAYVLGKVERREKSDKKFSAILVIRFYLPDASSRLNRVKRLLIERSKWFLSRVMSLTSQLREFQALSSLNSIPMLHIILNPVDHSYGHAESQKVDLSKLSQPMQNMLKSSFNDSQLQAVSVAIRSQASKKIELSLIQGPPGTGKTRTIVSIVSALLALQRVSRNCSSNTLTNTTRAANVLSNPIAHLTHTATIARAWQDATCAKQLLKDADKASTMPIDCASKGRVLICAQSNAAVDELVSRINEGIYGNDGKIYKPFIVRVGNAKTVHPDSLPIFIDTLVELRLAEEITTMGTIGGGNDSNAETSISLRVKLEKLVERIRYYESKRAKSKDGDANMKDTSGNDISKEDDNEEVSDAAIGAKLNKLYREKRLIYQDLLSAQAQEKKITEESRARKHKIRKSILREAEIVITTLSGCGGDLYGVCYGSTSSGNSGRFTDQFFFDVVVIDEAAQALEPATLIPLQLLKSNGAKCIMVGDPKQLPATVLSSVASQFLYECSMFERLQKAGHPVILLTEQYRMHPEICSFPSLHFYDNKLLNGVSAASKSAQFHEHAYLGPYTFYDIVDGCEHHGKSSSSLSLYNKAEVEAAISIMRSLRKRYSSDFASRKIGIITPYKSQLQLLRSHFSSAFGSSAVYDMQFNTVDGFQGREVDILLLSTVRSSISVSKSAASIGFVADIRRMNVALTRAKISLWIVGNARTLQTNPHWAALIQNAKERNLFVSVHRPYDSLFKESTNKNDMAKSTQEEAEQDEDGDAFGKKAKLAKRFGLAASERISRVRNDKQRDSLAMTFPKNSNSSREGEKSSLKEKAAKNVSANASQRNRACENTLEKSQRAADKEKPPKPLAKDLLAIRKQQRDDIEALLPSALISSKKTGKPSSSSSASKKPRN